MALGDLTVHEDLLKRGFIACLIEERLAFQMLNLPELVDLGGERFAVIQDIWPFAGADPRPFAKRLIDCYKSDRGHDYKCLIDIACTADYITTVFPAEFFNEAPLCQERAWFAWFITDAARQAINDNDDALTHREQALVDALLLRYRSIVELVPVPEGNEVMQITAAQTFQLKVETAGMIRAAEDLMSLTRELKEIWLFGPLRHLYEGEGEAEARMEENARLLARIVDTFSQGHGREISAEEDGEQTRSNDAGRMEG